MDSEKLRNIDFWDNDYDFNMAIHMKGESLHMSFSKQDPKDIVTENEIINALAYGIISIGNDIGGRYEHALQRILERCKEIENMQKERKDV